MKNTINYKIPGLAAIVLVAVSICAAAYWLFISSVILGMVYCAIAAITALSMLYFYCRKCPHVTDGNCRHTIIGPVVKKLFKLIPPAPYTAGEILFAFIPGALFVLFPQYWLFKNIHSLIFFWTPMIIAAIMIIIGVCPTCGNVHCFLCRSRSRQNGAKGGLDNHENRFILFQRNGKFSCRRP